jgi:Asp-tRNA(Asn)/Glu-tRNA(Gln) amidotransferase A subunit family amidase
VTDIEDIANRTAAAGIKAAGMVTVGKLNMTEFGKAADHTGIYKFLATPRGRP